VCHDREIADVRKIGHGAAPKGLKLAPFNGGSAAILQGLSGTMTRARTFDRE